MSTELLVRLGVYPKMRAALDVLPPKMLSLTSERPAEPRVLDLAAEQSATRVEGVVACDGLQHIQECDVPKVGRERSADLKALSRMLYHD